MKLCGFQMGIGRNYILQNKFYMVLKEYLHYIQMRIARVHQNALHTLNFSLR